MEASGLNWKKSSMLSVQNSDASEQVVAITVTALR